MDKTQVKTVYLVRHGQSADNVLPVYQSVSSPLSEAGKRQANELAKRLQSLDFDLLVSSPLPRAAETTQYIVKQTGKPVTSSDLFVERIKPDGVEGKPWTDSKASKIWEDWNDSLFTPGKRVGNGENYDDILTRADQALDFLSHQSASTTVVVSHGYFLRVVTARILFGNLITGPAMRQFISHVSMENTGITTLLYNSDAGEGPTWRLLTYNDYSHLNSD